MTRRLRLPRRLRRWYCRTAHRDLWVWDHYAASWVCVKCRTYWASPCKAGAPTCSYRVTWVHQDGTESEVQK